MRPLRCLIAAMLCGLLFAAGCAANRSTTPNAAGGPVPASTSLSALTTTSASPVAGTGYDPKRDAAADIEAALKQAAGDKRAVLLDFGADWCPDCVLLQKLFTSDEAAPLLRKSYHLVSIDVGHFDRNLALAKKYVNLGRSGIPALVVLDSNGSVRIATNDGAFTSERTMQAADVAEFLSRWAP